MLPALVILSVILAGGLALFASKFARHRKVTMAAINGVMEPYRLGDYQAALEAAEGFRDDGEITAEYCFFRGASLSHLGRLEEAETWLRRNIALHTAAGDKRRLAIGLTSLGNVLLRAGHYDEAKKCFQDSIRTAPDRGSGYRSLAELCLVRGGDPAEAAGLAKLAVQREQADKVHSASLRNLNLGEDLATLAWAIAAELHDAAQVARLADAAIAGVGDTNVQSTAQVHYHLGCAFAELGDLATSAGHYEEAARIDPQGHWGRAARSRAAV
jgi:tetratricopeptide (TPR) repeat protein